MKSVSAAFARSSLWTAITPPATPTPPLEEPTFADVCIVGGGYCGLSAALHLAERGADVVLLEAHEPGWGASGRNGGQVIPGLKIDPPELLRMFGEERGRALVTFSARNAQTVFDLIDRCAMDVPNARAGWIQAAHTVAALKETERRAERWRAWGAPAEPLGRDAVARLLGAPGYLGGWVDRRGGAIQPLAFARGLAKAAQAAGARIHGGTRVVRLEPVAGRWRVLSDAGVDVEAAQVLVATNGYADGLLPELPKTIMAIDSLQIATGPISERLRRTILPQGHVASDTRKLLLYFRLDSQGRLLMGGRGALSEPSQAADWAHLERAVRALFPATVGAPILYRWGGRVAVTRDSLPHLHEPAPGVLVDIGCMGRGIGLQTHLGKSIARYLGSGRPEHLPLPITPMRPIPMHALKGLFLNAVLAWRRATDGGVK